MGNTMKKLGRGLAAGLLAVGQEEQRKKTEEIERKRYEEEAARKERQLRLQEAESAQRQEQGRLNNMIKRAQWKNQQMVKAAVRSNYDPNVMDKAWNQYGNNSGSDWTYNAKKSAAAGEGVIIYDVGAKLKNDDGTDVMGPDGKPLAPSLPGSFGEQRFENQDDHVNFFIRSADPAYALAHDQANMTAKQLLANAQEQHDKRIANDPVYRAKWANDQELAALNTKAKKVDIRYKTAQAGLAEKKLERGVAEERKTPAQAAVSSFKGVGGNVIKQTAKDVEKAKAFAAAINKQGGDPISVDEAARMMQMKNDPKAQAIVERDMKKLTAGEMTETEFRKKYKSARLPKMFIDRMLESVEMPEVEDEDGFSWSKFWSNKNK